jgi:catechol 2,3-dioxygenase-like lactoylglutathione lyase family enzyme
MLKHFDHLTIVVRDLEGAKAFFRVLGFKEAKSVIIAGEPFASYMGVQEIKSGSCYPSFGECISTNRDSTPTLSTPATCSRPPYPRPTQDWHEPHLFCGG